jgi:putative transposase
MATQTITLKLPFLKLNQCKVQEFEQFTHLNTQLANEMLKLSKSERRKLSSKDFADEVLGSMWVNQTIRNANAKTKVKQFKVLPLEINNQGWSLHKQGDTWSVCFNLYRRGHGHKRIPLEIHQSSHETILKNVLAGQVKAGSLKLVCSSKGIWLVLLSVSMEVPETSTPQNWIGVDRGQNVIAVASVPSGMAKFYGGGKIKALRRKYAQLRKQLQKGKKQKALKKLGCKERRAIRAINHKVSKELVQLALDYDCGLSLEDLGGIRKSKQSKKVKSDSGSNRDYWSYYQLECFVKYKAAKAGVEVRLVPAAYTSQSCSRCGHLGERRKHDFHCVNCGLRGHADWNASVVIGKWEGFHCSLELKKVVDVMSAVVSESGVYEAPLTLVSS